MILPTRIRAGLAEAACPANAAPMQAYLKSAMPCHGLRMSDLRRIVRPML
ncbi:MAG: DNA alkylation repair protein, partial [Micrococcales bacterium]